jgi:hypothetical protein
MYIHIPMLDAMQVPTYARYLMDILNQKRPISKTIRLVFAERCSVAILDGVTPQNFKFWNVTKIH